MKPAIALVVLTALLAVTEAMLPVHGHWPPGTNGAIGIVGCIAIVLVSKLIGEKWLQVAEPGPGSIEDASTRNTNGEAGGNGEANRDGETAGGAAPNHLSQPTHRPPRPHGSDR